MSLPNRPKRSWVWLMIVVLAAFLQADDRWENYKARFLAKDGRVIDRINQDITHSEAVGYTLTLACRYDDLSTFKKVLKWADDNLRTQTDGLYGWKWGKDTKGQWHLLDANNATDGDLWIVHALLCMSRKDPDLAENYRNTARKSVQAIKKHLIVQAGNRTFLLPGLHGFATADRIKLNPSYLLLHIYRQIEAFDQDKIWKKLYDDALWLLEKARFTPLKLHPDWIEIDRKSGRLITKGPSLRFGYDALRIPWNILLDRPGKCNDLLEGYRRYIAAMKAADTVFGIVDLKRGQIQMEASFPFFTLYDLIENRRDFTRRYRKFIDPKDYYGYALDLLMHP